MNSPFVRRLRLAAELRALREDRGITAEQLSRMLHKSRTKISRLENGRVRPNVGEIMDILDCLKVGGDKWAEIVEVARGATAKGWWLGFGDAMDSRQCLLADVESGASTVREYSQFMVPGVLQTRDYMRFVIDLALAGEDCRFLPERALEAQLRRQNEFLGPEGPCYEVIIDEIVIRRSTAPLEIMVRQLRRLIEVAERHPHVTVRVAPLAADFSGRLLPNSGFSIYSFPDPGDPSIALVDTLIKNVVHVDPKEVASYGQLYECLREAALSATASLGLMIDLAGELQSR